MAEVSDVVAARAQSEKEFNRCDHGNIRPHRDRHGQGKQPDAAVGKENRVGHEKYENCAGRTDGWNIQRPDQQAGESLDNEAAGADQHEKLYARGDEAPPIEVVTARSESAHNCSVRSKGPAVKVPSINHSL